MIKKVIEEFPTISWALVRRTKRRRRKSSSGKEGKIRVDKSFIEVGRRER